MNKRIFLLSAVSTIVFSAFACTNFIVGKKASTDGSVICSYNADSYGAYMPLYHYAAAKHQKGDKRQIYEWDTNKYLGEIDEALETYNVVGNINEWQVTIGETTYGGREEMVDSTGIIDYGSLIYMRVVWVAQRIPDDAICAHANQSRIGKFDMKDKQNVLYSKNVVKFARQKGWFSGKDEDFAWKWAYAAPDFSGRRICDARAWSFFNRHKKGMDRYLPWVLGIEKDAEDMPLWVVPDKKVSVEDVMNAMRDHFEGTPMEIDSTDIGGGIWQMPYRPTPLFFNVDGKKYFNERPVSTQQSAFTFVSQMRSWLPREVGGCFWFGNDDANMIAYVPIYCSMTRRPECFNAPGADDITFSDKSAYWVCNWVSNMVYPRYSVMFPDLQQVRDSLQKAYFAQQPAIEARAKTMSAVEMQQYLNDYSVAQAQGMLARWKQLATFLIVRHNDMARRPVDGQGRFKRGKHGLGATVERPGYPSPYARRLVNEAGQRYLHP